ncbi:MAG: hypothetical protein ACKVON_04505 [Beijerinckiaceae bacterium]
MPSDLQADAGRETSLLQRDLVQEVIMAYNTGHPRAPFSEALVRIQKGRQGIRKLRSRCITDCTGAVRD